MVHQRLALVAALISLSISTSAFGSISTPAPVSGRTLEPAVTLPADVLGRVLLLTQHVEEVQKFMGRSGDRRTLVGVNNAVPREVYFQALAVLQRANRLNFEVTRDAGYQPPERPNEIRPMHVFQVVDLALGSVLAVQQELGIESAAKEIEQPLTTTPSHVLHAMIQACRQLDMLLLRPVDSSDVFEQLTVAVQYAESILALSPNLPRLPPAAATSKDKTPGQVAALLVSVFEGLRPVFKAWKIPMLDLSKESLAHSTVTDGDVLQLSALLVSELAYLHQRATGTKPIPGAFYPGRRYPFHVYQRATVLQQQLASLLKLARQRPHLVRN